MSSAAAPPAKKKKGLTLEEKRAVMLDILLSSGEAFNLKDLEKLGARAGVVEKTVKDVVDSLVADKAVEVDKIGSGNFYWAFPSAVVLNIKTQAAALEAEAAKEAAAAAAAEARAAELAEGRTDGAARAAALAALDAARAERAAVDAQLKAYAESDPDALAELQAKARKAKAAADRWVRSRRARARARNVARSPRSFCEPPCARATPSAPPPPTRTHARAPCRRTTCGVCGCACSAARARARAHGCFPPCPLSPLYQRANKRLPFPLPLPPCPLTPRSAEELPDRQIRQGAAGVRRDDRHRRRLRLRQLRATARTHARAP
jgi:hypothetical protein